MTVEPYHSSTRGSTVWHNRDDCGIGLRIHDENLRAGRCEPFRMYCVICRGLGGEPPEPGTIVSYGLCDCPARQARE